MRLLGTKITFIRSFFLLLLIPLFGGNVAAQAPPEKGTPIVPIAAKPLVDQSVPAGWRRYQLGERPEFSVILPSVPEASAEREPKSGSIVNLYVSNNASGIYVASRLDGIPGDVQRADRQEMFFKEYFAGFAKGFQQSMAANNLNFQLQLVDAKAITTATGRQGFQQDLIVGPFKGRAQLVFVGTSSFCVISIWNENASTTDSQAFFNSFRVTTTPNDGFR